VNLVVYLIGAAGASLGWFENPRVLSDWGHYDPAHFKAWQLVTYQFLHDPSGILHIAFNMLFLWVFGCAVEDRLGRASYLVFYLMGGALAALAHGAFDRSPVIGASGSIAGISGAFLALFPRSRIKILFFFFIIGIYNIPSLWFIGFYFLIDVLKQTGASLGGGGGGVAYAAHIAGYIWGFSLAFVLLATKLLKREEFDVFYLFTQSRRRAAFRAVSRGGPAGMWESASADAEQRLLREAKQAKPVPESTARHAELRAEINRLAADHDLGAAAEKYRQLLDEAPNSVLLEQRQLDVANQLYAEHDFAHAAAAYELLLDHYPSARGAGEVQLILAVIYARHLDRPARARELIESAQSKLRDQAQTALAHELLGELSA
jgi:membrane associated rhomboid family serine protease